MTGRGTPLVAGTALTLVGLLGAVLLGLASRGGASPWTVSAAQEEASQPVSLSEGERFEGGPWALEVQNSFVVPSGNRYGYSEVRVAVALQNLGDQELPYEWAGLAGGSGYPELILRDGGENRIPINRAAPTSFSVPGSALVALPGSVPARWTIGYQVPTAFAADLTIVARWEGGDVAAWTLTGQGSEVHPGWSPPVEATAARWGDVIEWSPGLSVSPLGNDVEVCGDPNRQHVVTVYGLAVQVQNTGSEDAPWPGVHHPLDTAIAVWTDGASARNGGLISSETFVTTSSTQAREVLQGLGPEARVIPPHTTNLRMLGFSLPRDSRFGSAFTLPQSVVLYPPSGTVTWLETPGSVLIDFTVPDEVCTEVAASVPFDVVPPA